MDGNTRCCRCVTPGAAAEAAPMSHLRRRQYGDSSGVFEMDEWKPFSQKCLSIFRGAPELAAATLPQFALAHRTATAAMVTRISRMCKERVLVAGLELFADDRYVLVWGLF